MGCCHPCHNVEFVLEEDDWDEMVGVEPDHVVHSAVIGTELIGLEVVVLGDGVV